MLPKRRLRAPWVVTVAAGAIACGGSTTLGAPEPDGGDDSGNPAGCPASAPTVGAPCALPGSESCQYGSQCSPSTYECTNGAWTHFIGNPPRPTCPTTLPSGPCPCFPPNMQCTYGNGMCNGQPNPATATCSNGQWTVAIATCNPPAPDSGVFDATADVVTIDAGHD